jgi:aminomethyltransferase
MNREARIPASVATAGREQSPRGLLPTPFGPRLRALSRAEDWEGWGGWLAPRTLDDAVQEYFAIRNTAALIDISPIRKYRIEGPEAARVADRLVTRKVADMAQGRVAYCLWCDEDGFVIDDGTLFRLAPDNFRLCCQERMLGWLADVAWGFDAEVRDETEEVAALALQGPTSFAVLEAAGLDVAALRRFDLAVQEPGLTVSRTGFTGDLGYELWVSPEDALPLWDRLMEAGRVHGLRAAGMAALDVARIEAGFPQTMAEFQSIHRALRPSRGRTPYELGLGRLVHLDKPHFNGRRALVRLSREKPRRSLVMLDIEGSRPACGALVYRRALGRWRETGHVTSACWAPTAKRNIAFAEIEASAADGRLAAEIYLDKEGKWERRMARAVPTDRAVFRPARARATPPGRL